MFEVFRLLIVCWSAKHITQNGECPYNGSNNGARDTLIHCVEYIHQNALQAEASDNGEEYWYGEPLARRWAM